VFLIGYAIFRSTVEIFRGDYQAGEIRAGLTPGQFVSVGIVAVGIALLVWLPRKNASVKQG
jgi:prolipoprotein diacylglyceryltransferase